MTAAALKAIEAIANTELAVAATGPVSEVKTDEPVDNVIQLVQPVDGTTDDTRAALVVTPTAPVKVGPSPLMQGAFLIGKAIGSTVKAVDNSLIWIGQTVINGMKGAKSLSSDALWGTAHSIAYAYAYGKCVAEVGAKRGQRAGSKHFYTKK